MRYVFAADGTTATLCGGRRLASRRRRSWNSAMLTPGASSPSASSCLRARQRCASKQARSQVLFAAQIHEALIYTQRQGKSHLWVAEGGGLASCSEGSTAQGLGRTSESSQRPSSTSHSASYPACFACHVGKKHLWTARVAKACARMQAHQSFSTGVA